MSAYPADILNRRATHFVLWLPSLALAKPPELLLGTYGADGVFHQLLLQPLGVLADAPGLWQLAAQAVDPPLTDGGVYHYWFRVGGATVTDPLAFAVDYAFVTDADRTEALQPPAVIKFRAGALWPCDVRGDEPGRPPVPPVQTLPANSQLVIYELPASWTAAGSSDDAANGAPTTAVDRGTFADVLALFETSAPGRRFSGVSAVRDGAILAELGINALELLPVADAKARGTWGYASAHYCAPDYDLGTASELVALVSAISSAGVRFFLDVVMAFGHDPYTAVDFAPFHIDAAAEPDNPDSYQSHAVGQLREAFGGSLWRYVRAEPDTYDPETGLAANVHPSWAFHKTHLARWMTDFGVGGLRLDSVNNIGNWDFVRDFRNRAWELYNSRYAGSADASRFLVIGEELSMPVSMIRQAGCVDALWNEPWQQRLRAALLGEGWAGDNLEWTVRKLVDCRQDTTIGDGTFSFTDDSQAILYVTSHDIEGYRKNRLYNFCQDYGIEDVAKRARLAFALLLTSVGVPMIFAGEEFADQEDIAKTEDDYMAHRKQIDPVNYARKDDGGWRQALFAYVANLVRFRTKCPALSFDDTNVFHVDDSRGGRIMAWSRGPTDGTPPVVVVANFSDEDTPGTEYVVPNWPDKTVAGWREVSQRRDVPPEWVGREPLFSWEAKIYTYWIEAA